MKALALEHNANQIKEPVLLLNENSSIVSKLIRPLNALALPYVYREN